MSGLVIKGFLETSFLDWDGKITAVIFLPECNFRCPFCHNFGLISRPEQFPSIDPEKVIEFLKEHHDFLDGLCVTGGEPCLHAKELKEFLSRVKALNFSVKLDTNGYQPAVLEELLAAKLIDYLAMDIKGPLDERYNELAGIRVKIELIKRSVSLIMKSGLDYEFRTTVIPGQIGAEAVADIAREIAGAKKYVLQQFIPQNSRDEGYRTLAAYQPEKLAELRQIAAEFVPNTVVRGA